MRHEFEHPKTSFSITVVLWRTRLTEFPLNVELMIHRLKLTSVLCFPISTDHFCTTNRSRVSHETALCLTSISIGCKEIEPLVSRRVISENHSTLLASKTRTFILTTQVTDYIPSLSLDLQVALLEIGASRPFAT